MAARPSDSVSGLRCQCCSCCGGFKRVTASPSDSVSVVRKVPLTFVVSQTVVLAFHSQAHSHWPDRGGRLALPRFRRVGPLHAWKLSRALSCVWIRAAFPGERAGRLYDVASFPRATGPPRRRPMTTLLKLMSSMRRRCPTFMAGPRVLSLLCLGSALQAHDVWTIAIGGPTYSMVATETEQGNFGPRQ